MVGWPLGVLATVLVYEAVERIPAAAVHGRVRALCKDARVNHFDHKSMLHSSVMGFCALGCFLWELAFAETQYPRRIYACLGPSSRLVSWLAPVEVGFAVSELIGVFRRKWDRLLLIHGTLTSSGIVALRVLGVEHFAYIIYIIHLSTVPLNLRGIDFGPAANLAVDVAFATVFVGLRLVVLLGWWVQFLVHGYYLDPGQWGGCVTRSFFTVVLVLGPVIHGMNLYWGRLVLRGVWRKLRGKSTRTGRSSDTGFAD